MLIACANACGVESGAKLLKLMSGEASSLRPQCRDEGRAAHHRCPLDCFAALQGLADSRLVELGGLGNEIGRRYLRRVAYLKAQQTLSDVVNDTVKSQAQSFGMPATPSAYVTSSRFL